ncbi:MAG: class I SAM-dependent methyltransferase [Solirubrobacterales bacterium]|nr:class I SAM-dependent methyltransferase [Solirubrobacterales bacterium]
MARLGGFHRARRAPRALLRRAERMLYPPAGSAGEQWQRVQLNRAVDGHLSGLGPAGLRAAEISGDNHAHRDWREYTSLMHPEFDLCAPVASPGKYDVVICEQVLEHVPDPCGAAANLRSLSAPGGRVIVSTPFLIKLHELPIYDMRDYWRFTPRGLRTLLEGAGLEVETVGSWGNRDVVIGNLGGWSARRRWHSLNNNPELPVQVWAFAVNPDDDPDSSGSVENRPSRGLES